jgi:release factor glutamine methyltransferase
VSAQPTDIRRGTPLMALVHDHAQTLARGGVDSAESDALALAAHAFGMPPVRLRVATADDVAPQTVQRLATLVARRAARIPLQHLTGEVGFRHLTLACRRGVFVPRPETEVLAGLAIERAPASPLVIEPGTGAGAVALAIATEVGGATVVATDTSAPALVLARDNLRRCARDPGLARGAKVLLHRGDLFRPVDSDLRGQVDLVVSNPPYLTAAEVDASPPEVRDHDPREALVAGQDGEAVLNRLVAESPSWLRPGGWLLLETTETRVGRLCERVREAGYSEVEVAADLAGRERFVVARWDR